MWLIILLYVGPDLFGLCVCPFSIAEKGGFVLGVFGTEDQPLGKILHALVLGFVVHLIEMCKFFIVGGLMRSGAMGFAISRLQEHAIACKTVFTIFDDEHTELEVTAVDVMAGFHLNVSSIGERKVIVGLFAKKAIEATGNRCAHQIPLSLTSGGS
jgi:hypothetical protein